MILEFTGEAIEWRGPAPFVFVPMPEPMSAEVKNVATTISYGWGCIPVTVRIGKTEFTTAMIPRNGVYMVPIKVAVQRSENVSVGDTVEVQIEITSG
ncbi:MAG: DUF1905 domain-containing protein [Fimbriimonadaceae bacterium]|nr:DUF1905 domain-containing protein [Fimbriimonadaceae bacterium]